jgi:hypothetical protein
MKNADEKVILALKLAVSWADFKTFCKSRTSCKACPKLDILEDCPYLEGHICSATSTEKILTKIAETAREYLLEKGLL